MRIAHLFVYPVKSARGVAVAHATATPSGLLGDRHFMLVDRDGRFFTQRECPRLALLGVDHEPGGASLVLTSEGRTLAVPWCGAAGAQTREVVVWRDTLTCEDAGDEAAAFVSEHAGAELRLVRFGAASSRPLADRYGPGGTELADGSPVLVASLASLAPLAAGDPPQLPTIRRFRANVVIDGDAPFAEEGPARLLVRGGEVVFRLVKRCPRCPVIDVDPDTGVREKGTLAALARARPAKSAEELAEGEKRAVYFGMDAVVERAGPLAVGDLVTFA